MYTAIGTERLLLFILLYAPTHPPIHSQSLTAGCPTNETNDQGVTPQKLAKAEGMKDAMKELKKLTTFQDKAARGGKPKGYAEPWCVRVSHGYISSLSFSPFSNSYTTGYNATSDPLLTF